MYRQIKIEIIKSWGAQTTADCVMIKLKPILREVESRLCFD